MLSFSFLYSSQRFWNSVFQTCVSIVTQLTIGVSLRSVHLVELRGTGLVFAMKAMDKSVMMQRNKVHRARAERDILALMDHPFLPTLYATFQVDHLSSFGSFPWLMSAPVCNQL